MKFSKNSILPSVLFLLVSQKIPCKPSSTYYMQDTETTSWQTPTKTNSSTSMGSIIFQWGPSWEKKLEIQKKLRGLTEEDLLTGAKQIYNHAENPQTAPTTQTTDELDYINEQNVNKYKKGKLDAYALLIGLIKNDVTEAFLVRFKPCFLTVVAPQLPLWYVTPIEGSTSEDSQEVGPNFCV